MGRERQQGLIVNVKMKDKRGCLPAAHRVLRWGSKPQCPPFPFSPYAGGERCILGHFLLKLEKALLRDLPVLVTPSPPHRRAYILAVVSRDPCYQAPHTDNCLSAEGIQPGLMAPH